MNILESTKKYETWLFEQLKKELVEDDLLKKYKRMKKDSFPFLRATYWRWAECILQVCPDLASAPPVLAIGDIHLENFGTWRDADGRLVWGVNDFDEAAEMPYVFDLARLATSAALVRPSHGIPLDEICTALCSGYEAGLERKCPFVLDEHHKWLRKKAAVKNSARDEFWEDMSPSQATPPPKRRYRIALDQVLPEKLGLVYWPRTAGTGSLGRPRWVGRGEWRGAPLLREAKAMVRSGWVIANDPQRSQLRCDDIAHGRHRSPDPWYRLVDDVLVRRLSPNNRKIDVEHDLFAIFDSRMLEAMGHDLASIHLGTLEAQVLLRDFRNRKRRLQGAVENAVKFIAKEQKLWATSWNGGLLTK
jgi:hypothetical protein